MVVLEVVALVDILVAARDVVPAAARSGRGVTRGTCGWDGNENCRVDPNYEPILRLS